VAVIDDFVTTCGPVILHTFTRRLGAEFLMTASVSEQGFAIPPTSAAQCPARDLVCASNNLFPVQYPLGSPAVFSE